MKYLWKRMQNAYSKIEFIKHRGYKKMFIWLLRTLTIIYFKLQIKESKSFLELIIIVTTPHLQII